MNKSRSSRASSEQKLAAKKVKTPPLESVKNSASSPTGGASKPSSHFALKLRLKEVILVLVAALALFLFLALLTYHLGDSSWSFQANEASVRNAGGKVGAYSADFLLSLLGFFGFLFPFLMIYGAWVLYREPKNEDPQSLNAFFMGLRLIGIAAVFSGGSGFSALALADLSHHLPQGAGGILGAEMLSWALPELNNIGSAFLFVALIAIGFTFYGGFGWFRGLCLGFCHLGDFFKKGFSKMKASKTPEDPEFASPSMAKGEPPEIFNRALKSAKMTIETNPVEASEAPKSAIEMLLKKPKFSKESMKVSLPEKPVVETVAPLAPISSSLSGEIPSVDLLDNPQAKPQEVSEEALHELAQLAEEKLRDFGVDVNVVGAIPGPVITRFELQLAPGVKVGKLTNLSKDLARSLSVHSVRVVEVIPGKSYVGLEIPNDTRQTVRLKEVLSSREYLDHHSPLAMGLGLNIQGSPEVVDLQKMPHLLVAGTTGSGKSVGLNAMLLSLLLKSAPDDLRLIMIDPKMLELSIYEGIPHLLAPVVTDMKQAANALRWCVKEMDRRYQLMAAMAVRNIGGYNEKIKAAETAGEPIRSPLQKDNPEAELLTPMPYIVVLVDEFADMIMVVGKKVEELIARLAQKARAAGIHLIVATQRPSVDVITGLIKANIPTRMAFQVSSKIDSRTILDQSGAEQLLGYGDMLYLPPGSGHPIRVHGAFVADAEVQKVVEAWRAWGVPQYHPDVIKSLSEEEDADRENSSGGSSGQDELFDEAVQFVLETQRASISAVQRRFRIGYNRSARLIEDMEAAGIVSEVMPNGMREVLVRQ